MEAKSLKKWGLIGGGVLVVFCCLPVTCVTMIGGLASTSDLEQATEEMNSFGDSMREKSERIRESNQRRMNNDDGEGAPSAPTETAEDRADKTNEAASPSTTNTRAEVASDANDASSSNSDDGIMDVGQAFDLGDYSYKVIQWKTINQLGGQFMQTRPSQGATFVILEYEITNNTNKTQTAMTGDFKLIDGRGREFRTASKVETALSMSDPNNQDFLVSELQPGLKRTMRTGFEVPVDAASGSLTLIIPEKGFMGRDEVRVKLQ